jgi:hypothetical protein
VTLLSSDPLREWYEDIVVFAQERGGVSYGTVWRYRPFVLPDVDVVKLYGPAQQGVTEDAQESNGDFEICRWWPLRKRGQCEGGPWKWMKMRGVVGWS